MQTANKHTITDLHQMQSLPLKDKIRMTQRRIEEWYEHYDGNVYLSFSGGKDSTVLLHLVREMYPDVPAVFVNTGLEYPEIVKFVKTFDNVEIIRPKISFVQVIKKYGYPMFSKEVSECVYGARKYLTSLLESGMLDRPTDRPTDRISYRYWYERVTGQGAYSKCPIAEYAKNIPIEEWHFATRDMQNIMGWRRKEPGILHKPFLETQNRDSGLFGKQRSWERWFRSAVGNHDGDSDIQSDNKGEYP